MDNGSQPYLPRDVLLPIATLSIVLPLSHDEALGYRQLKKGTPTYVKEFNLRSRVKRLVWWKWVSKWYNHALNESHLLHKTIYHMCFPGTIMRRNDWNLSINRRLSSSVHKQYFHTKKDEGYGLPTIPLYQHRIGRKTRKERLAMIKQMRQQRNNVPPRMYHPPQIARGVIPLPPLNLRPMVDYGITITHNGLG